MVCVELGCNNSTITGFSGTWDKKSDSAEQFGLVRRCIKISLTRADFDMLPATYERIFSSCRALVIDYKRGEDLYGALKLELEHSLTDLAGILIKGSKEEIDWLADFAAHCEWFESQIVSCLYFVQNILMRELV
jgi:cullin-4